MIRILLRGQLEEEHMKASRSESEIENKSLLRLIDNGMCSVADIRRASREAEKLASGEIASEMRSLEHMFRVLGDRNRLTIMALLSGREMCVCELMTAIKATQPTTSRNLNMMEHAGLVRKRRAGKWALYSLADSPVNRIISALQRRVEV